MFTQEEREALKQGLKKNQAERKEREERRAGAANGEFTYENIEYKPLITGEKVLFRAVGRPDYMRTDPSDDKPVLISEIKGDDDKYFRMVWPEYETNKDFIMWKIFYKVLDSKWEMNKDKNMKEKIYINETLHPECFRRVRYNNNTDATKLKFEEGWKPTRYVVMNVIDRQDAEWHKEHKHTKLLSGKMSEWVTKDGKEAQKFDPGIKVKLYNTMKDTVMEYFGAYEDYDICVKKMDADPWYEAFNAEHDLCKLDGDSIKDLVVCGPLTPEEESYEKYDLDKLFHVTTYTKIKAKLEKFIKKVDADFDTNYFDELEELVEKEKAEWEKNKTKSEEEAESTDLSTSKESSEIVNVDNGEIPWDKLADGTYNGTIYKGVPFMTDAMKDLVIRVNQDGSFEYKPEAGRLYTDTVSKFKSPGCFTHDPLTGKVFMD